MNKEEVYITKSFEETKLLGEKCAKNLKAGGIIALYGELGGGKTTFVQGIALGLGIERRIISPTFIIVRTYELNIENAKNFYHIDLYRTQNQDDIKGLGLEEIISDGKNIVAIEWAEKMGEFLPEKRTDIFFKYIEGDKREIKIIKHE